MQQEPAKAKLVIVGDGAIGKTCVMVRYAEGHFDHEYTPTIFENRTKEVFYEGRPVHLSMWDTAGQEQYSRLRPIAYPNTDVFLIAFSVTEPGSFINAKKKWFPQIKNEVPTAKVLFVGTKADLRNSANYSSQQLSARDIEKNLKQELGCEYRECSAMMGEGVEQVFTEGTRIALVKQGLIKNASSSSASQRRSIQSKTSSKSIEQSNGGEKENASEGTCYCSVM